MFQFSFFLTPQIGFRIPGTQFFVGYIPVINPRDIITLLVTWLAANIVATLW